jgi:hypothetical protein
MDIHDRRRRPGVGRRGGDEFLYTSRLRQNMMANQDPGDAA